MHQQILLSSTIRNLKLHRDQDTLSNRNRASRVRTQSQSGESSAKRWVKLMSRFYSVKEAIRIPHRDNKSISSKHKTPITRIKSSHNRSLWSQNCQSNLWKLLRRTHHNLNTNLIKSCRPIFNRRCNCSHSLIWLLRHSWTSALKNSSLFKIRIQKLLMKHSSNSSISKNSRKEIILFCFYAKKFRIWSHKSSYWGLNRIRAAFRISLGWLQAQDLVQPR